MESTAATESTQAVAVDTELAQLNISEQLRANSSFMKIMATLFHYGNQAMNAAQLVIAVRALNLLPLRGETPKSTIQGIISTSRKIARDLKLSDPFRIDKDGAGRQAKYAIADEIVKGVQVPDIIDIPNEPIVLRPVDHAISSANYYANHGAKRQRKAPSIYSPAAKLRQKKKSRIQKSKKKQPVEPISDVEVDSDEDEYEFTSLASDDEESSQSQIIEEDTIAHYSLVYAPPTTDIDYIDPINFTEYPIAGHFAIVQQKGYSYPRFRSHEKIKIPKVHCEDKFRVTDILSKDKKVTGRLFILADGHGGPGCSEYFVRKTPAAVDTLCAQYDATQLGDPAIQKRLEAEIKAMIQTLDDDYLALKRQQIAAKKSPDDHVDNDGCTLILNIFFGEWLININVGDSRTVLISAPEPSTAPPTCIENVNAAGIDNDYKMDVVFASQDHKPYLEHLARHILENGGEFVDSVQNRVIKVELDKLREDGNRHTKRVALKNARIRPKDYQAGLDQSVTLTAQETTVTTDPETTPTVEQLPELVEEKEPVEASESIPTPAIPATTEGGTVWATQSAVRTTVNNNNGASANASSPMAAQQQPTLKSRLREDRIPSLNVARSCGDLDFKMDPQRKIISCEPDVTFIRISDQPYVDHTILLNGPHKEKRRHFLFMSTDGTFDYMYEETAERQNRAIAKVIGPMIEDGEKIGKFLLEEEERVKGQTIEHGKQQQQEETPVEAMDQDTKEEMNGSDQVKPEQKTEDQEDEKMEEVINQEEPEDDSKMDIDVPNNGNEGQAEPEQPEREQSEKDQAEKEQGEKDLAETDQKDQEEKIQDEQDQEEKVQGEQSQEEKVQGEQDQAENGQGEQAQGENAADQEEVKEELPRIPLLHRELTEEETKNRKVKEATLVSSARYFANREGAHGFFASTLQDYDDCTIILVEI